MKKQISIFLRHPNRPILRVAIARQRDRASSAIRRGEGPKRTAASPVRGVSFLKAVMVTGDAAMVVVVTLSGREEKKIGNGFLCAQGKSSRKGSGAVAPAGSNWGFAVDEGPWRAGPCKVRSAAAGVLPRGMPRPEAPASTSNWRQLQDRVTTDHMKLERQTGPRQVFVFVSCTYTHLVSLELVAERRRPTPPLASNVPATSLRRLDSGP